MAMSTNSVFPYCGFIYCLFVFANFVNSDTTDVIFTDISRFQFGLKMPGRIAAYGNYNGDKKVDIFVVVGERTVLIHFWKDAEPHFGSTEAEVNIEYDGVGEITSVTPGDFDGDGFMDVLVVAQKSDSSLAHLTIYWGGGVPATLVDGLDVAADGLADQPLVLDANGDMIPDILGVDSSSGRRAIWSVGTNRTVVQTDDLFERLEDAADVVVPNTNAFVDVVGEDLEADVVIATVGEGNRRQFEVWRMDGGAGRLYLDTTVTAPTELEYLGRAGFVDLDSDGRVDIVQPGCVASDCGSGSSRVYAYSFASQQWDLVVSDLQLSGRSVQFHSRPPRYPVQLNFADYNFDRFPDAVVIVKDGDSTAAVVLENVECLGPVEVCEGTRTFRPRSLPALDGTPILASFFDLNGNGILDVVLSVEKSSEVTVVALGNPNDFDTNFLKVWVLSGLCEYTCPDGAAVDGDNQPGPTIRYATVDAGGATVSASATQLTQSAYNSLQMPYVIFGIGRSANYVEKLQVGIPASSTTPNTTRSASWSAIIPNSQMIVNPFPLDKPSLWMNTLLITPNATVWQTGVALLCICFVCSVVAGGLHIRELKDDKAEKKQEAQRFHFDAM